MSRIRFFCTAKSTLCEDVCKMAAEIFQRRRRRMRVAQKMVHGAWKKHLAQREKDVMWRLRLANESVKKFWQTVAGGRTWPHELVSVTGKMTCASVDTSLGPEPPPLVSASTEFVKTGRSAGGGSRRKYMDKGVSPSMARRPSKRKRPSTSLAPCSEPQSGNHPISVDVNVSTFAFGSLPSDLLGDEKIERLQDWRTKDVADSAQANLTLSLRRYAEGMLTHLIREAIEKLVPLSSSSEGDSARPSAVPDAAESVQQPPKSKRRRRSSTPTQTVSSKGPEESKGYDLEPHQSPPERVLETTQSHRSEAATIAPTGDDIPLDNIPTTGSVTLPSDSSVQLPPPLIDGVQATPTAIPLVNEETPKSTKVPPDGEKARLKGSVDCAVSSLGICARGSASLCSSASLCGSSCIKKTVCRWDSEAKETLYPPVESFSGVTNVFSSASLRDALHPRSRQDESHWRGLKQVDTVTRERPARVVEIFSTEPEETRCMGLAVNLSSEDTDLLSRLMAMHISSRSDLSASLAALVQLRHLASSARLKVSSACEEELVRIFAKDPLFNNFVTGTETAGAELDAQTVILECRKLLSSVLPAPVAIQEYYAQTVMKYSFQDWFKRRLSDQYVFVQSTTTDDDESTTDTVSATAPLPPTATTSSGSRPLWMAVKREDFLSNSLVEWHHLVLPFEALVFIIKRHIRERKRLKLGIANQTVTSQTVRIHGPQSRRTSNQQDSPNTMTSEAFVLQQALRDSRASAATSAGSVPASTSATVEHGSNHRSTLGPSSSNSSQTSPSGTSNRLFDNMQAPTQTFSPPVGGGGGGLNRVVTQVINSLPNWLVAIKNGAKVFHAVEALYSSFISIGGLLFRANSSTLR